MLKLFQNKKIINREIIKKIGIPNNKKICTRKNSNKYNKCNLKLEKMFFKLEAVVPLHNF
jgi:hypothetical protein